MREDGWVIVTDPGSDVPLMEAGTLQCCHCGGHWIAMPGSKRVRGYCSPCGGPFCGPECQKCVPTEQLLENMERGNFLDFRPIIVAAGG